MAGVETQDWANGTSRKADYITNTYLNPALRRQFITNLKTKDVVEALQGIPVSLASNARQYLGGRTPVYCRNGQ